MALSHNLGFPRIGLRRELKKACESFWSGKISDDELLKTAATLRSSHWQLQQSLHIDLIPSNDFSLYDHVLDTIALVGAVPERYRWKGTNVPLDIYFAMARGSQTERLDVVAMEMTKWFDTNYHYIVPEFQRNQTFHLASSKAFDEFLEAKSIGIITKPVLLGPISFLLLGKGNEPGFHRLSLLENLLPVYAETIKKLHELGAEWIQLDEPCLALDRTEEERKVYEKSYRTLRSAAPGIKILLATYFEGLRENLPTALNLPVDAVHLDLLRAPQQLDEALNLVPQNLILSLGVVDGRNIWKNDFAASLALLERAVHHIGTERIMVAPSCSLLYVPYDLDAEPELDAELKSWLAFARQKLMEVNILSRAITEGQDAVKDELEANESALRKRHESSRIHNPAVKARCASVVPEDTQRKSPYAMRRLKQQAKLKLPNFPTTTIGSFPQTDEVRLWRAKLKKGEWSQAEYEQRVMKEIERVIRWQEEIGFDVLVHGEFERSDMVEYFAEQLNGFTFTQNGWVQSYGSRCVKPPIIFGDVSRPAAMTLRWMTSAQSLTQKPVKGMLTGPITLLQWSFVRDDQPRSETARQLALAIRDEVCDLERAGISIIQIDEPAVREGLPQRKADWAAYLKWAVECFRLSSSGVEDDIQIQTHLCYSEFGDIIDAIDALDADVVLMWCARAGMRLLDDLKRCGYKREIGPGVYDVHSPRIPPKEEFIQLIHKATEVLDIHQIWVNPDCGLKTRGWKETEASLANMIAAALEMRSILSTEEEKRISLKEKTVI